MSASVSPLPVGRPRPMAPSRDPAFAARVFWLSLDLVLLWPTALELPPALLFALGLAARAVPVKNIESAKTVAVRLRFLFIFYSLLNFLNCLN